MKDFFMEYGFLIIGSGSMLCVLLMIALTTSPGAPAIYTDPATGCQYLVTNNGITPRMSHNHEHICND